MDKQYDDYRKLKQKILETIQEIEKLDETLNNIKKARSLLRQFEFVPNMG